MLQRKLSDSTKAKISQSMQQLHASKTEAEKQATRAKQSETMKRLWSEIPKAENEWDDESLHNQE